MSQPKQHRRNLTRTRSQVFADFQETVKWWWFAIVKLRHQLMDECRNRKAAARRFQQQRLLENLNGEIEKTNLIRTWIRLYWLFCGSPLQDKLGYNEARNSIMPS